MHDSFCFGSFLYHVGLDDTNHLSHLFYEIAPIKKEKESCSSGLGMGNDKGKRKILTTGCIYVINQEKFFARNH